MAIIMTGTNAVPSYALAAEPKISKENPVAILGGGGRTGKEVAAVLAREGLYGVTMTRTGKSPLLPAYAKEYIENYPEPVNVCDADGLMSALSTVKASAIVYCASASRQGGSAFQVDDMGVANAANVAKSLGARFVLVSALGVDRPDSKGFQMTNSLGGNYDKIMDAKRQGEDKVRSILSKTKNYIIVRPGPLLGVKSRNGAIDIELNQGDIIGGGISRDELAGVVVGALQCQETGATVEVYRAKTRQKIQPDFDLISGNEATADTYVSLFANVKSD
jgi:nucleoside-diphosphate-sugar epimerase